jgi:hypothetical protein
MQQITHPNNPRPTSPPHAVNPASRLIIQINFCRAQDADPDPDPFCSFYFKDGRRSSCWVVGWVHCRRPLARPCAEATKNFPSADLKVAKTVFQALVKRLEHKFIQLWARCCPSQILSNLRQSMLPFTNLSNFGQRCCPSQILSNFGQRCCPSQILSNFGQRYCPSQILSSLRAARMLPLTNLSNFGQDAAPQKFIHLGRAGRPSTWEWQFIPVFGRLLET